MTNKTVIFACTGIGAVAIFLLNMFCGAVGIPVTSVWDILCGNGGSNASWQFIVLQSRLPQAFTALFVGMALSVCGLLMQAVFRNPLADPSILGVSSGSGLGVALVVLCTGGSLSVCSVSVGGFVAILLAAFVGALAVTALMFTLSGIVRSSTLLLIIGVMVGYFASSAIMILNFFASADGVRSYMLWGMGNFASVSVGRLPLLAVATVVCLVLAMTLAKPLNALVLGSKYAENLGVDTRGLRNKVLLIAGILTALSTAFCGPIAFVGLAVPHMARLLLRTDDYRLLLPFTMLAGAVVALACNLACSMPADGGVLPVNAITPIAGVPMMLYIMLKRRV